MRTRIFGHAFAKSWVTNLGGNAMKKLKKYRMTSSRHDSPRAGRHIPFQAILAFASRGVEFTKKENAHFDVCGACRLKVVEALKNVA